MNFLVTPLYVPATIIPDLVLIYRQHLTSDKVSQKDVFVVKIDIDHPIKQTIVYPVLFKI